MRADPNNPRHRKIAGWSMTLIFCLLVYSCVAVSRMPNSPHVADEEMKLSAWVYCQEAVRASLKSPRSADFPWKIEVMRDGTDYVVNSWVEAENAFGAKLRTPYYCRAAHTGDDKDTGWAINDLQFVQ